VDGGNVGVIEGGEYFGFSLESGNTAGILGELIGQHLDRHIACEFLILCLKYFTHAAFAELAYDLVMSERFADHVETLYVVSRATQ
jgi:hypothetical protein